MLLKYENYLKTIRKLTVLKFKLSSEIESDLPSHPRPLILLLEPTASLPLKKVTLEQLSSEQRNWLEYIGAVVVATKEHWQLEQLWLRWTSRYTLFMRRCWLLSMVFHIFHGFSRWRFFCRLSVDMLSSPSYHASSPLWLVILTIDQSDISTNILSYHHLYKLGRLAWLPSWSWWTTSPQFRWRRRTWWLRRPSFLSLSWHFPSACRFGWSPMAQEGQNQETDNDENLTFHWRCVYKTISKA